MAKVIKTFIFICLLLMVWSPSNYALEQKLELTQELEQLIQQDEVLDGGLASISIRKATTGELIYDYFGDTRLRPASNMKLLTAAAALSTLGENYTFQTDLLTNGNILWKMVTGNIYIKGKGDPTLLKENIDELIEKLKNKGVTLIRGDLIGDDNWFDDIRYSVDLPWSDETTYYGAAISALTASPNKDYDAGTVIIEVAPGDIIGEPGSISLTPHTTYVDIINNTITVSENQLANVSVTRKHGSNEVQIEGQVPLHCDYPKKWVAIWEPTDFVLHLTKESLKEHGITLLGTIKRGKTPEEATPLASHESIALRKLLIPFMKNSNNGHAETLIKEMGKVRKGVGSFEKGIEVLQSEMKNFNVNSNTLKIRDGSGISHVNLIPANEISQLLFSIQAEPWFPSFFRALPTVGGQDSLDKGTLKSRMSNSKAVGKVKAKTGTLNTVSSLSGYVETSTGEMLIFSILLNNVLDEKKAKELEDEIVIKLASWGSS
ncbi:D-alanyl-D-alanine carboxypeptidase/D-alanyl-D-alanine-endopeptidase [Halalkalibacter kiskunsagensis]|uniref:D-alanyl-D-alanine carboxypeptidase/D-alanyl-D-alanine-endopeptidase n=1 Tax=Halalkalibacter kiskunsagensis TaxID=1548599 RepID=A0ABV6KGX4_9BACI